MANPRFIFVDIDDNPPSDSVEDIFESMDDCDMFYDDDVCYEGYLIDIVNMTVKKATFGINRTRIIDIR